MVPWNKAIIWTEQGRNTLDEAVEYLAKESLTAAQNLLLDALNSVSSLSTLSERGGVSIHYFYNKIYQTALSIQFPIRNRRTGIVGRKRTGIVVIRNEGDFDNQCLRIKTVQRQILSPRPIFRDIPIGKNNGRNLPVNISMIMQCPRRRRQQKIPGARWLAEN